MKKIILFLICLLCFSCQSKIIVYDIETGKSLEIKEKDLSTFLKISKRIEIKQKIDDSQDLENQLMK